MLLDGLVKETSQSVQILCGAIWRTLGAAAVNGLDDRPIGLCLTVQYSFYCGPPCGNSAQ